MKTNHNFLLNDSTQFNSKDLSFILSIFAKKITRFLLYTVAILVILSTLTQAATYILPDFILRDFIARKLSLFEEQSFPTLYSSITLFFCSVLFWMIAQYKSKLKDKYTFSWKSLSFIFIYLSLDELLSFHEHLTIIFRQLGFDGVLHYAWVVPGLIGIGIFCIIFYRFFMHLPQYMKQLTLLAFSVFIGGAIVAEMMGGYYKYLYGKENLGYFLIATIEESMEMLGVIILIHALLTYLERIGLDTINIQLKVSQSYLKTHKSK